MVERKEYLDKLQQWKDEQQIKVVTGIRRCGNNVKLYIMVKQLLKINKKFYMVDMGIRNHILPRKRYDLGFTIENIVYLELLRRGGKVNIGKYGSTEVDFVTQKEGVLTYYQVTADMTAKETFEREMRLLKSIQDNYEKIVLTLDRFSLGNYDGIKVVNVIDWLLE